MVFSRYRLIIHRHAISDIFIGFELPWMTQKIGLARLTARPSEGFTIETPGRSKTISARQINILTHDYEIQIR